MTADLNHKLFEICRITPNKYNLDLWTRDNERSYGKVKKLLNQGADPNVTIHTTAHARQSDGWGLPSDGQSLPGISLRQRNPHNLYPIIMAALVDNNGAIQALCEDPRLNLDRLYNDPEEEINDSFQACILKLNPKGLELQINTNPRLASAMMTPYGRMEAKLRNDVENIQDILHELERLPTLSEAEYSEYVKGLWYYYQ